MGPNCVTAYDSVALRIRIRPPTNAKSFSYRFDFYSAEYPEFLCEDFNDYFVALLTGATAPEIPADGNIAFDAMLNPVSVNNAFFDVCFPAVGAPPGAPLRDAPGPRAFACSTSISGAPDEHVPRALHPRTRRIP